MIVYKQKELLLAQYDSPCSLVERRLLESCILNFQQNKKCFTKSEYNQLWSGNSSTPILKKSVDQLKVKEFHIPLYSPDKELIFDEIDYDGGKIYFQFSQEYKQYISL